MSGLLSATLFLCPLLGCAAFTPTDPYQGLGPTPEIRQSDTASTLPEGTDEVALPQPMDTGISLERAIAMALAHNPELAAASFDAAAARAGSQAAQGILWPSLSVQGGYARHLDDQRLIPARYNGEPGTYGDDVFSGDLLVRAPLFTGGKLINASRAADLMHQSAAHDLARTREELIFNVSSVFYAILAQKSLILSLEFSTTTLEGHLKRINDMIDAQKAAMVDRFRTEVRLSNVRTALVRGKNVLRIQHCLLATLLGIEDTGETLRVSGTLKRKCGPNDCVTALSAKLGIPETRQPDISEAAALEFFLKTALDLRPDYQSARKKLEAQARQVDIARAGFSPDIMLIGVYGGRWTADPSEQMPGAGDSEDVGRVGLNIEFPLFEGGQTRARVREERAKLAAAQQRLQNLVLRIRLDVETAFADMTSASERVSATEKAVEQAGESLRIEQEKYALGRGAILDVLDAQAALLETQTNYYQALADVNIAVARLSLATGEYF